MVDLEVWLESDVLHRFRLSEVGRLSHVVVEELRKEGLVRGLREHALLFKDGQDAHWLDTTMVNDIVNNAMVKLHNKKQEKELLKIEGLSIGIHRLLRPRVIITCVIVMKS